MKQIIFVLVLVFLINDAWSQSQDPEVLKSKKSELELKIQEIDHEISNLEKQKSDYIKIISRIDKKLLEISPTSQNDLHIKMYTDYAGVTIRSKPSASSSEILKVPPYDSVYIINIESRTFAKVQYGDKLGFASLNSLLNKRVYNPDIEANCYLIDEKIDKFTDEIRYNSPLLSGIGFAKVIDQEDEEMYVYLSMKGDDPIGIRKGAYILLDNGNRLHFPNAEINSKVLDDDVYPYLYSSVILLSNEDIELLKNSIITDIRLFIHDQYIGPNNAHDLQFYLNCLLEE